ncbi:phage tail tape measure protein [Pseudomonas huanghezhanensis]|uniref:phage tail tape measure protein n=1 Tax=Pseudomonas huanghezhanensis TaxID=3002903 RepID=UPI002285C4A0|nr:phage tail tape measure protein [Pseudomonas sp. BSw22131]
MSDIELKLTADVDQATKSVGGFRKEFADLVRVVEKPLRQINTFRELENTIEKTGRQLATARDSVRALGDQMASTAIPTKQLQLEYRDATSQLKLLERQEASQSLQLGKMRRELQAAGTDTRNLASEQKRLQGELSRRLSTGQADKTVQTGKVDLGITKYSDSTAQISKLQEQFTLLRSTGRLTATEIAIGQNTLRQALSESSNQTRVLTGATATWKGGLSDVRSEILAGAAAFAGFALAAGSSFNSFASFQQQIAAIGTITDLTDDQLKGLSEGIRGISRDMGKQSTDSAAAVYELLGSGVETADVMKVLASSTKAAVAGMSDTKTAAGVGVSIINAYGESMGNLDTRYDQLFLAIKDGVVSFDQFSAGLGQVLPTAAAAKVSFSEVASSIARMTVQGIQAPQAFTGLTSAINQLAAPAPEAAKAMAALGIEWKGLTATIQQIAQKKIGFEAMRQIIPDTEGRTAILALSKNYAQFADQVDRLNHAAGATEVAYNKMKATPEAQMQRFDAAMKDLQNTFGAAVAAGLPVVRLLTDLLNAFNSLPEPLRNGIVSTVALGVAAGTLSLAIKSAAAVFALFRGSLSGVAPAAITAGSAIDGLSGKAGKLKGIFSGLGGTVLTAELIYVGGQLSQLYSLYSEMQELEKSQKDQAKTLDDLIRVNSTYKDTLVSTTAEVAKMSETERKEYVQRLQNAQTYYSKLAEQIARADSAKNGPTAPVTQEAMDAFKKSREYGKALEAEAGYEKQRTDSAQAYSDQLKGIQTKLTTDTKTALAKQVAAQRVATAEIKKALKEQVDTKKKYTDALAAIDGSGSTDPSYGAAQSLKVSARKALASGDVETAKKQADSALKMIQKLADNGENTYGFSGFIKELQAIETQADGISLDKAQEGLKAATAQAVDFKAELAKLKTLTITPTLSEDGMAQVKKQLRDLQTSLGQAVDPAIASNALPQGKNLAESLVNKVSGTAQAEVKNGVLATDANNGQLKYVPGQASYSDQSVGVTVKPQVSSDAASKIQSQLDQQGDIPVDLDPELPDLDSVDVPVETSVDSASVSEAQSQIAAMAEGLRRSLTIPVTVTGADGGPAVASSDIPTFARGDMVRGPGTGTSDSILARVSNGEFIMRAAAVRHYGPDLLRSINERRLPGFSSGGEVSPGFFPSVAAPSQDLLEQASPRAPENWGSLSLNAGGEVYQVQVERQDMGRILRNQRLKFGAP